MNEFDPFEPAFVADPFAVYAAMRASPRAPYSQRLDGFMITRYDDAVAVLRDAERFSSDERRAARPRARRSHNPPGRNIVSSDPPQHTRLRRILRAELTPRAAERWAERISAITDELLAARIIDGCLDVIADLAVPLPLRFTGELLGVPPEDLRQLRAWSEDEITAIADETQAQEVARLAASSERLHAYWRAAIAQARETAGQGPDLLSVLVGASDAQERLTEDELVAFLTLMLRAATHTTTNLIGNGMLALLQQPFALEMLRDRPELWPSAIDELLRFAGPVQSVFRIANRPTELHGVSLEAGDRVHVVLAAANRDETRFADPDLLRLDRVPSGQLGFGFGIHACLGAHLARLEAQIALSRLIERVPSPTLLLPRAALRWQRVWSLRELASLPLGGAKRELAS